MMTVDEAIRTRKSVRRFLPAPVPAATVREIIELAARAPSGHNIQPWRVYGVTGEPRARLWERQMQRNYVFFDAPAGLFVTMDRRLNTGSYIDIGMFLQNLLLAARGRGLHTCGQAAFGFE